MLVVDANVVAYFLVEGEKTNQARLLHAIDPDWQAPALIFYEIASVLARLAKEGAISMEAAQDAFATTLTLLTPVGCPCLGGRSIEIAVKLDVSAYDACYLATAELLGTPLATEDGRLLRLAPEIARAPASWSESVK
jgi:predicted nucleic acid-binding protein